MGYELTDDCNESSKVAAIGGLFLGIVILDVKAPRVDDTENIQDVLHVSGQNLMWLWERAWEVDRKKIETFRAENRLTALTGYLAKCFYGL